MVQSDIVKYLRSGHPHARGGLWDVVAEYQLDRDDLSVGCEWWNLAEDRVFQAITPPFLGSAADSWGRR